MYGLRNPWRWSFDRQTADLWIGDVGQGTREEVDLLTWPLVGGKNLGWKVYEGSWQRGSTMQPCSLAGSILPVMEYRRLSPNCSVTGGYRYRGPVSSLRGFYIFGDFCSGKVWFGSEDAGGTWSFEEFDNAGSSLRSFGEDQQGNVYVISGTTLYRFNDENELIFSDGFES